MLRDAFGRVVDYIRVSVTKQCNFRCQYCMPYTPSQAFDKERYIPLYRILEFLKVCIDHGIKKVRITGGEPLLREDLPEFIAKILQYAKMKNQPMSVGLTTNGFLLQKHAKALKDAGLERINISLDSLKAQRVVKISQKDALTQVLSGIEAAASLGFGLKINSVILRGVNEDEILDLFAFARGKNITIRFIEFMENIHASSQIQGVSEKEILHNLAQKYRFKQSEDAIMGPAKLYICDDGYVFGIIAPHRDDFCQACNKIRLTADGVICPCLYFQDSLDAKEALMSGEKEALIKLLRQAVSQKPEKNLWNEVQAARISTRAFYDTGG